MPSYQAILETRIDAAARWLARMPKPPPSKIVTVRLREQILLNATLALTAIAIASELRAQRFEIGGRR